MGWGDWIGLGQGIQSAGDAFTRGMLQRHQIQRENEAIQRALAQEARENQFRQDQIELERTRANDQRSLNESVLKQNELENSRTRYGMALQTAQNFPNAELPEAQAKEWLSDERAPLVQNRLYEGKTVSVGEPYNDPVLGEFDNKVTEPPRQGYMTRLPESERYRIEQLRNANRLFVQQMRRQMFEQKLAQDSSLAELRASLTAEQINSAERMAEARLGLGYDTLDQRALMENANNQVQMMIAELRAEAARNRQNFIFSIPGMTAQPGQAPGTAPAAPAPRAVPQVPPANRPGGPTQPTNTTPSPMSGPGSLADALRLAQEAKRTQKPPQR